MKQKSLICKTDSNILKLSALIVREELAYNDIPFSKSTVRCIKKKGYNVRVVR